MLRVVIVSSVNTKIFNLVQVLDGHISTCLNDTLFYSVLVNIVDCANYSSFSFCSVLCVQLFDFNIQCSYCSVNI